MEDKFQNTKVKLPNFFLIHLQKISTEKSLNTTDFYNCKIECFGDLKLSHGFCFSFVYFKPQNRALRLRDGETISHVTNSSTSVNEALSSHTSSNIISQFSWDYFDEQGYIKRGALRVGEDPYIKNRFNQQASDLIPSNRGIPDTRNFM